MGRNTNYAQAMKYATRAAFIVPTTILFRRWFNESWTVKYFDNHFARLSRPSDIPLFLAVLKRTRSSAGEKWNSFCNRLMGSQ